MPSTRSKGNYYEDLAVEHLRNKNLSIIDRNWYASRYGEIDIVCQYKDLIIFVEVKGRKSMTPLHDGLNSITPQKANKLWRSMQLYLQQKPDLVEKDIRFDLVIVQESRIDDSLKIEHLEGVELADLLFS